MWYLPKFKLINTAEDATHTMHNLYTLRGAKTRDARLWPMYLNQALQMWGDRYEVQITMHHWPTWGNAEITQLTKVLNAIPTNSCTTRPCTTPTWVTP
jgi:alkyl sulfatase BDS1-like metallo-beta-lactamase superfamily hydrolase